MKKALAKIRWFLNYLSWLSRYLRLKAGFNTLRDIKIFSIEFASICNLHCKYCFLEKKDRPRYLDINVYEKLIREVASNPQYNIKVMEWPISGEFLIYPDHKKVIDLTKRYMDEYPHFRPHVILNENMVLMNEEKIDLILNSGVVRQLICSIDGHDAATFEEMRPPAQFNVVLKNMRLLAQRNRDLGFPVFLQIHNGRNENSLNKELSTEMKEIFALGNYVSFWRPKFWNESFNHKEKRFLPAKGFCSFVFNNVTLSSSGAISKCCMDLKGSTEYADLKIHSLKEIWHSSIRKQFLTLMFRNRRDQLKGCNTCSITNTNNDNRYTNWMRTLKRYRFAYAKKRGLIYDPIR